MAGPSDEMRVQQAHRPKRDRADYKVNELKQLIHNWFQLERDRDLENKLDRTECVAGRFGIEQDASHAEIIVRTRQMNLRRWFTNGFNCQVKQHLMSCYENTPNCNVNMTPSCCIPL